MTCPAALRIAASARRRRRSVWLVWLWSTSRRGKGHGGRRRDPRPERLEALALRWLLDQPGHSVALWGARRPDQLDAVSSIDGWHLDADAMATIDAIIAEHVTDPAGPELMAPAAREEGA